jgi:uncharacterized membrane protein
VEDSDHRLEIAMGNMLRIGVTAAALVVLAGGVLYLWELRGPLPDYAHFRAGETAFTHVGSILLGAARFDSKSLIQFGILLLIATPIFRVLSGVVGFALLRDRFYTLVSAIVLAILLASFFTRR